MFIPVFPTSLVINIPLTTLCAACSFQAQRETIMHSIPKLVLVCNGPEIHQQERTKRDRLLLASAEEKAKRKQSKPKGYRGTNKMTGKEESWGKVREAMLNQKINLKNKIKRWKIELKFNVFSVKLR